jgi:hypothetical protein
MRSTPAWAVLARRSTIGRAACAVWSMALWAAPLARATVSLPLPVLMEPPLLPELMLPDEPVLPDEPAPLLPMLPDDWPLDE